MEGLLALLVYLLIGALVIYVVHLIIGMLKIRAEIKSIAYVIVAVFVLIWILYTLGPL